MISGQCIAKVANILDADIHLYSGKHAEKYIIEGKKKKAVCRIEEFICGGNTTREAFINVLLEINKHPTMSMRKKQDIQLIINELQGS